MSMGVLSAWKSVLYMLGAHRSHKKGSNPLDMDLRLVVSYHVNAGK